MYGIKSNIFVTQVKSMPIIVSFFFKILPGQKYRAMAFWPFIIVKDKDLISDKIIMNHEKIHLVQQKELLVLPFYFIYFLEYFYNRLNKMNHDDAYINISFEKEAYKYDSDLDYLKNRKLWALFRNS
ncbi:MAG: hypothetical protein ACKVQB_11665 [Bacteroidia bacterium]